MRVSLLTSLVVLGLTAWLRAEDPKAAPSTGEKLPAEAPAGQLRVLLIGGGSSHDFEKFFHQADASILQGAKCVTAYTANVDEAVGLLPQADVVVLSTNQSAFGAMAFQQELAKFAESGKGLVLLHPGLWYNWPAATGYNLRFAGGGARSHDALGSFTVTVNKADHPVMKDVPATFEITDELYQSTVDPAAQTEVLATTSVSAKTHQAHPSVWVVQHPQARIVSIALGHDQRAHDLPAFKSILANAVQWAAKKQP